MIRCRYINRARNARCEIDLERDEGMLMGMKVWIPDGSIIYAQPRKMAEYPALCSPLYKPKGK